MISLDLGRRLKEAGLEWEPKLGDKYGFKTDRGQLEFLICSKRDIVKISEYKVFKIYWLPRLDELLAEIERRGYRWHLYPYTLPINNKTTYACEVMYGDNTFFVYTGDSPEDAVGFALIRILEREKEAKQRCNLNREI